MAVVEACVGTQHRNSGRTRRRVIPGGHLRPFVATNDPVWGSWSSAALARAAEESVLVINPIVFAEVSVGFERVEDLEGALPAE